MVRNRLSELQANSKHIEPSDVAGPDEDGAEAAERQPLNLLDKDMSASTANFLETFDENVVSHINKVKKNVEEIRALQNTILISVKTGEKESAENRMNLLAEENKRLSRKIEVCSCSSPFS